MKIDWHYRFLKLIAGVLKEKQKFVQKISSI